MTLHQVERELREAMARDDWQAVERLSVVLDRIGVPQRPSNIMGAALWYAEQGMHVFPLQPRSKLPYPGTRGCKDATTDPEQITRWWREHPLSNLGLATGYVVDVVDFDGVRAHAAWGELWADVPSMDLVPGAPLLATVTTPRPGGLHAYVVATGEGNRANMVAGVDYRGRGGYVVAPPSYTDTGSYAFLRPFNPGLTPHPTTCR